MISAQDQLLGQLVRQYRLLDSSSTATIDDMSINDNASNGGLQKETALILTIVLIPTIFFAVIAIICCCNPDIASRIDAFINTDTRAESDRAYGQAILQQQLDEEEKKKEDPAERRDRLEEYFKTNSVQIRVTKDMFHQNKKRSYSHLTLSTEPNLSEKCSYEKDDEEMQNGNLSKDDDGSYSLSDGEIKNLSIDEEDKEIFIPETIFTDDGLEKNFSNGGRKVQNCCAICLCGYDVDDVITWSTNEECIHAFHRECILDYLQGQLRTPCPCCRNEFTDLLPQSEVSEQEGSDERRLHPFSRAFTRRVFRTRYSSVEGREQPTIPE